MNVSCIRVDRLGESLLTLPAVKFIKENIDNVSISFLGQEYLWPLCQHLDFINKFISFPDTNNEALAVFSPQFFKAIHLLKIENSNVVICFHSRKDLHLLSFLSGAANKIGYNRKWGFLLNKTIEDNKQRGLPEYVYNLELANLLVNRRFSYDNLIFGFLNGLDASVGKKALSKLNLSPTKKYIIAHIFSSDNRKLWPYDNWRALFSKINEDIILIGSPAETGIARRIFSDMPNVKIAVGLWDIYELACVMSHFAGFFMGLDSGPMHLAYMSGLKVFVLWGYADIERWGPPKGFGNIVINEGDIKELECKFVLNRLISNFQVKANQ